MERRISEKLLKFSKGLNKLLKLDSSPVYGEIKDPLEHVNHRYGSGWVYCDTHILEEFDPIDMDMFSASDHCTLASLTAITRFHRKQGYSNFPSEDKEIFNSVFNIANKDGYYEKKVGTYPWRMAKISNSLFKSFGYRGRSKNKFVFFGEKHIGNILKKEIDAGRPGLINFAHGSYRDHSTTYYGYVEFQRGEEKKLYLLINNNWNTSRVYVDVSRIGNINTPFSITKIIV